MGTRLGNSDGKGERKVALFLTAVASIVFVKTGGGAKIVKCVTQNCKDKITMYLK